MHNDLCDGEAEDANILVQELEKNGESELADELEQCSHPIQAAKEDPLDAEEEREFLRVMGMNQSRE